MGLINILFDLDGTLTDPGIGICRSIQYALSKLGFDEPAQADLYWCIGPPLRDSFSKILNTSDRKLLDQAIAFYRRRFSETGIYENTAYDGVGEALSSLRQKDLRIFLATAKPKVFADRILDHFLLTPFFNASYGSELDGRFTDKADLIRHIVEQESLSPLETIMIGDRSHDIVGGKKNRIATGAVTYGYGNEAELKQAVPDFRFDSPVEWAHFLTAAENNQRP